MRISLQPTIENILKNTINPITKEEIKLYQNKENQSIDFILNLCYAFTNQLNMETATIINTSYGTKRANITKKNNKYTWAELNQYGARIIYLIRFLLAQDNLSFLLGVSNGKTTKQAFISQFEMMSKMEFTSRGAIGVKTAQLQQQLTKITNKQRVNKRINQWNLVQQLATVSKTPSIKREHNGHIIYQKEKADNLVWVKYSGTKTERKNYYYNINNSNNPDDFVFYNMGWLWQWYNAILRGNDDIKYQLVHEDLKNHSIRSIIGSRDNIAGTKTGDFQDAQYRQIQSKFNNEKIISYNNIKVIMIELTKALEAWKLSNYGMTEQNNLQKILQTHFFPDGVLVGDELANQKYEEIIKTLKQPLANMIIT